MRKPSEKKLIEEVVAEIFSGMSSKSAPVMRRLIRGVLESSFRSKERENRAGLSTRRIVGRNQQGRDSSSRRRVAARPRFNYPDPGEIVCLDRRGHSQFNALMYHRGEPYFYAFVLLWLDGDDLRGLPLIDRKKALRKVIPRRGSRLLYLDHIQRRGEDLFRLTCKRDLEGIVAKWKKGAYVEGERPSWVKIKNRDYSQIIGREKLFEKRVKRTTAVPA